MNDKKIDLLIKVFSSTDPFPHSSVMPRYVLNFTHRMMRREDLTEGPIGDYFESLKDERAKGRFMARWAWWRYKASQSRRYFERKFFGPSERDNDEREKPKYYKAYWAELNKIVNAGWQELSLGMIGPPIFSDVLPNDFETIGKFIEFVKRFFAQKRQQAEKDTQHAIRGKKILKAVSKGGHERARQVYEQTREQYRTALVEYRNENKYVSLTAARQRIADRFGISRRTVERHTRDLFQK